VSRGQHTADDASFQKSAGGAMARGLVLIIAAVVLGIVLLNATDSPEPFTKAESKGDTSVSTTTTASTDAEGGATTTTAAPEKAHKPGEVAVLVVNGSRVAGAAGRNATKLAGSGFKILPAGNTENPAAASNVYYQPGYQADAQAIAGLLSPKPGVLPMPTPAPVKDLQGANVLVVVAADLSK
jgi:hypothetical protein